MSQPREVNRDSDHVGALQVVAVYMVLGIAADDIFVFIDAWKRSAFLHPQIFQGKKEKRMGTDTLRASVSIVPPERARRRRTKRNNFPVGLTPPTSDIRCLGVAGGSTLPR